MLSLRKIPSFLFVISLLAAVIAGFSGCDLFNNSMSDYFEDNTADVEIAGVTVKDYPPDYPVSPATMADGTILIPEGETGLGFPLANSRNLDVGFDYSYSSTESGVIEAKLNGIGEVEVAISGAAEGEKFELSLVVHNPNGVREPTRRVVRLNCVSFDTGLKDFTINGATPPGFDPLPDSSSPPSFSYNNRTDMYVPFTTAAADLRWQTVHPGASLYVYNSDACVTDLLGNAGVDAGTASLNNRSLTPGNNFFFLKVEKSPAAAAYYTVNIYRGENDSKELTGFYFDINLQKYGADGDAVAGSGTITEGTHTVAVTVPYGTDVSALTPTVSHTGASYIPTGPRDFTSPQTYTIRAVDTTTRDYTVTVTKAALSSIAVVTPPTKTSYHIGESLDTAGIVVTGTSLGTTINVTADCTYSGFDSETPGDNKTVTVRHTPSNLTATFTVNVTATVVNGTALSLNGLVIAPVTGNTPVITAGGSPTQYTAGTITWLTSDNSPHSGAFTGAQVYKAQVTLTAAGVYTFTGVGSFTYTGATVAVITNIGTEITLTITFPATKTTVNGTALSLNGLVIAPVTGNTPVITAGGSPTQYTAGTITWFKGDNSAHSGAFTGEQVYKAEVSLSAAAGYTFTGVGSFTYTGATVTASSNTGAAITLTITFPATAPAVVTDTDLSSLVLAPRAGNSPNTGTSSQYWVSATWSPSGTPFTDNTVYTATVTLEPKTGYTFAGVAAGTSFFTHAGATTINNSAGSGTSITVTITFPTTGYGKTVLQGLIDTVPSAGGTLILTGYNRFDIDEGPISIEKDITIQADNGQTVTINTTGSGGFKIFKITNGGKLTLGGTTGSIIFDGGALWTGGDGTPAGGASNYTGAVNREPFIEVKTGGEFVMNGGVTMQNNDVTIDGGMSGAIEVAGGTATINGGTIKNCAAIKSDDSAGAIKIINEGTGVLTMTGGSITGNRGGNGTTAGSIYIQGGSAAFTWSGGTITNNSPKNLSPYYVGSILNDGGTLNNSSGTTAD